MKSFMLIAVFFLAFACETAPEKEMQEEGIKLPMEVTYKGVPKFGSSKNVQTVMEWNKRLSSLNVDVGDLLADTVTLHLSDGLEVTVLRDGAIGVVESFINDLSKLEVTMVAAVPVDMIGPHHEWVFAWTEEKYTYKDGTVEEVFLHEDYRLVDQRIREVYQYERQKPAAADTLQ